MKHITAELKILKLSEIQARHKCKYLQEILQSVEGLICYFGLRRLGQLPESMET
jgi:hypothetical protein